MFQIGGVLFASYYWQMCYFNSKVFLHSHRQIERQLHPEESQSRSCKLELFGESGFLYICRVFLRFFYSKQTLFFFMEIETIFIMETRTIASNIYIIIFNLYIYRSSVQQNIHLHTIYCIFWLEENSINLMSFV